MSSASQIIVVGAGFTGLSAALELQKWGFKPIVLEQEDYVGGLAGSFDLAGVKLEKFYHHWFKSDVHVHELVHELGEQENLSYRNTNTGNYYANSLFRLARPIDVLKYSPLSLWGRIRLGLLVFQARAVRDWRALEDETATEWLRRHCGAEVYERVWQPLMYGKFGDQAAFVSAVWIWNKLALRGASRDSSGREVLAYYRGGFGALAETLKSRIVAQGGSVLLGERVVGLLPGAYGAEVTTSLGRRYGGDAVLVTTALAPFAELVAPHSDASYVRDLHRIKYLGNVCLTLVLDRSLSDTYWINVTDPDFPFVGVIEHTNFEPPETYGGAHIVYLSKYLAVDTPMFSFDADQMFDFAAPFLIRMFPDFRREWVTSKHLHREKYSQPIVTKRYSELIPESRTPIPGVWLATMAQIYPEDRGTNYAIREGRRVAQRMAADLQSPAPTAIASATGLR